MTLNDQLKGASHKLGEITGHTAVVAEQIANNYELKSRAISGYHKVTGRSAEVDGTLLTYTLPATIAVASTKLPAVVNDVAQSFVEGFNEVHNRPTPTPTPNSSQNQASPTTQ